MGLGSSTLNVLCVSVLNGMNGAQDTLVSQAFGLNDLQLCGRYLNRGRAILLVAFCPIMLVLLARKAS